MNTHRAALAALIGMTVAATSVVALAAPVANTTAPAGPPRGTIEVSSWSWGVANTPKAAKDCVTKGGTVMQHEGQQACRMPVKSSSSSPDYGATSH
jgi:hypothetical protein